MAVAAVVVALLPARRTGSRGGGDARQAGARPNRDFAAEREGARLAGMSAEDRAWEAGSLQRNRDRHERADAEAEQGWPPS